MAVFLLFVTSCSESETSASNTPQEEETEALTDRPNIVFVLTDDLDYAAAQKMPTFGKSGSTTAHSASVTSGFGWLHRTTP